MQFKEKTTTHQVAVLQQVWKRIKIAELQTINQIVDATGLSFNSVCEVLYDYAESCFKTKDVSMRYRSMHRKWKWLTKSSSSPRPVLLGAIWRTIPSAKFLSCFRRAAECRKTARSFNDYHVFLNNGGVV
jgi:hypothetical protein